MSWDTPHHSIGWNNVVKCTPFYHPRIRMKQPPSLGKAGREKQTRDLPDVYDVLQRAITCANATTTPGPAGVQGV